MTIEMNF